MTVLEGSETVLRCEVQQLGGQVQWTKDGFALGEFLNAWRSDSEFAIFICKPWAIGIYRMWMDVEAYFITQKWNQFFNLPTSCRVYNNTFPLMSLSRMWLVVDWKASSPLLFVWCPLNQETESEGGWIEHIEFLLQIKWTAYQSHKMQSLAEYWNIIK